METPTTRIADLSPTKQALLVIDQLREKVTRLEQSAAEPIAIIGMGCRFPGAPDLESYWRLLAEGGDAVREIPPSRWDAGALYDPDPSAQGKISTKWAGLVDGIDRFDPAFFGISPREALAMDPQQRMLLEVAWEALEHACQTPGQMAKSATGVFVGITGDEWSQHILKTGDTSRLDIHFAAGIARSVAGGRISYFLGMQGPNLSIDTACSSSLTAIHTACLHLRAKECRTAIAGGANTILSPEITMSFCKAGMMAPDGRCKAFDAAADGFVRGEGCGLVVLKRLSEAVADGDRIWAVIRGSAVNQDGRSSGLTVPNGPAQEAVIRQALERAGVAGREIDYVEAHGTGTSLGDPIEAHALAGVLGEGREQALVVGSVKTNLGHLESAAGVAGLIKVVLSLQAERIPAHLHFERMNPHIDWRGMAVEIPVEGKEWKRGERRRLAGVSSFGFSGTNAHVIVEEAPAEEERAEAARAGQRGGPRVVALSGRTAEALAEAEKRWARKLEQTPEARLDDVGRTANEGRAHFAERSAVVAATVEELRAGFAQEASFAQEIRAKRKRGRAQERLKVGFLFSGQGAQYAGMGRELYEREPAFREVIEECERVLAGEWTEPLREVLWGSRTEWLDQTQYTQPALFAVELGLAALWRSWGIEPAAMLGHSIGEYVAVTAAGGCTLAEGLRLVAERGRRMGQLVGEGAMAAVQGSEAAVWEAVREAGAQVSVGAVNAPDSVVVSGYRTEVEAVAERMRAKGYRVEPLRVSHGFHSPQMEPMVGDFERRAGAVPWKACQRTVVSSVTGQVLRREEIGEAGYWGRQVREAVQFRRAMETLAGQGIGAYVEIGPGTTLLGLGRLTVGEGGGGGELTWAASLRRSRGESEQMAESLAELYVRGAKVDWNGYEKGRGGRWMSLPAYPFQRQRYWIDAGEGGATAGAKPATRRTGHPLLGERIELAGAGGGWVWQAEIDIEGLPWLGDHVVQDTAIFPATAYLEMAAAAGAETGTREVTVVDIVIHRPLKVTKQWAVTVQTVLRDGAVEIYSRQGEEWVLHASAQVQAGDALPEARSLESLRQELSRSTDAGDFYEALAARGHHFGSSFRRVSALFAEGDEALAQIEFLHEDGYRLHPALLDACIQPLAATTAAAGHSYLPLGIGRFAMEAPSSGPLWSHVRARVAEEGSSKVLWATIAIRDAAGRLVGAIEDLQLRPARALSAEEDCFFAIDWERRDPRPPCADDVRESAEAVRDAAPGLFAEHNLAACDRLWGPLNLKCAHAFATALGELLPHPLAPGTRVDAQALAEECAVIPAQRKLFERLFGLAAEVGMVRASGAAWELVCDRPVQAPMDWSELLGRFPEFEAQIEITCRCAEGLAGVLSGKQDPLQLLFPEGSKSTAEELYSTSPSARVFNELLARSLAEAVSRRGTRDKIRILEIGAGTGGATAYLAPVLLADRTDYQYTDVSRSFFARARERFAAYPFLRYDALDIDRDPEAQGFGAGEYDIVVASNVLHATADLRQALRRIRRMLAPGGMLVLLEVTHPEWWIDVTFGTTEGWWRFRDQDIRPSYVLLDNPAWLKLLAEEGFRSSEAVTTGSPSLNTVFLAPVHHDAACPAGQFLAVGAGGARAAKITKRLQDGGLALRVLPEGARVRDALSEQRWAGVLYLAALDAPDTGDLAGASQDDLGARACRSLVDYLQSGGAEGPRLHIVTSKAQRLGREGEVSIAQSPIWGIARTIPYELPKLSCVTIDVDDADPSGAAAAILEELSRPDGEAEVLWREGVRHVARLKTVELEGAQQQFALARMRLEIPRRGLLENLVVAKAERRTPGPRQVEIEVAAAGLGFRDVLNVMGLYPGDPGPLGGECAGRVVSVGSGVTEFKPGDEVIALAPGALDGYVLADERLVAFRPKGVAAEDAVTIPSSLVTVEIALGRIAGIEAGQTVLVHGATGGVGLCAVQKAQAMGAEVFATAGSEEKRRYLRELGLKHVYDSRSTDFGAEVLRETAGRGVDVVLNSATGEIRDESFRAIANGGCFVEIGKNGIWPVDRVESLGKSIRYRVLDWSETAEANPAEIGSILREGMEQLGRGALRPLPKAVFGFADAIEAFRMMARARHVGRVVLRQPAAAPVISSTGTYLITGGTRGLGLSVARKLVQSGARYLALLARSEPSNEVGTALAELEKDGARVVTVQADVSKFDELEAALRTVREQLPALVGVIHAAGVLSDSLLVEQAWEGFAQVLSPKVEGAWNLHQLTAGDRLEQFVLFSSVASVLGAPGQASHAAANCFEDALAHARRSRGLPAVAIDWGSWGEIGSAVDAKLAASRKEVGMLDFGTEEGLAVLERILKSSPVQVAAAKMDWRSFGAQFQGRAWPRRLNAIDVSASRRISPEPKAAKPSVAPGLRERLAATPEGARTRLIAEELQVIAARVLGYPPGTRIDEREPMNGLGLDSLMAVEFRNELARVVGQPLPVTLLFSYPALGDLLRFLCEEVFHLTADQTRGVEAEKAAPESGLVDAIEDLSDEEVERRLAERTSGRL